MTNALVGFVGVECGVDLYQFSKEELRRAKSEALVQQVLLNAPVAQGRFVCISVRQSMPGCPARPPMHAGQGHPGKWGLAAVPGLEGAFRDSVATALEYAGALDCKRVHFMAGTCPAGEGQDELCRRTFVSNLRFAARECRKVGLLSLCGPQVVVSCCAASLLPYTLQHSVTALIEPISVIPDYFLKHQCQGQPLPPSPPCALMYT